MTSISVCLCTFKRDHVFETLRSISVARSELSPDVRFNVVVVNNDPSNSAIEIELLRCCEQLEMNAVVATEPRRGISSARNRCLDLAQGEWLAFIDDDELAAPSWLSKLLSAARTSGSECIMGSVKGQTMTGDWSWWVEKGFFDRGFFQPGEELSDGRTGNCLVKTDFIREHQLRFQEEFGLTGGEDTKFFRDLRKRGGRIIAAPEAMVWEIVGGERLSLEYMTRRAISGGDIYARINHTDVGNSARLFLIFRYIFQGLVYSAIMIFWIAISRARAVRAWLGICGQVGKLRHLANDKDGKAELIHLLHIGTDKWEGR